MNSLKLPNEKRLVTIVLVVSLVISLQLSASLTREAAVETTHEVKITDFAFVPQNLIINLGDTVTWNNTDPVIHTLWFVHVANQSTYLLSDPIPPDSTWTYTFNDAVQLQYYSFDKLWITGFINVTGGVHDVAVTKVTPQKTVVGQGYNDRINVTVANEGDFIETFNVTTYADTTTIEMKEVTLASGDSTTITFTWNTTGFAYGNYTISATADQVPGETDTADNTFVDGWVVVTIPGDINGDGKVDHKDLLLLASAYGSKTGDPRYIPEADINGDGKVDHRDLLILAANYGKGT